MRLAIDVRKTALLILATILAASFQIPSTYATTATIVQVGPENDCTSCSSRAMTFGGNTAKGDGLYVFAIQHTSSSNIFNTPTDTQGNTFTQGSCLANAGPGWFGCSWYTNTTQAAADTITVTTTGNANWGTVIFDARGVYNSDICTASGSGTSGTTITTSTSCSWSSQAAVMSLAYSDDSGLIKGTGFSGGAGACLLQATQVFKCQYADNTNNPQPANPTSFPWTQSSSGNWLDIGIMVPNTFTSVTVTTVVACTWFQLQCWLYPAFFAGVYLVLILGIAVKGQVDQKDLEGFTIEALVIGTLIGVMIGILNVMIPLLLIILHVVRAIRA